MNRAFCVQDDRLQQPVRFDIGRKLVELVIGEHREQRGDGMDGQLAHPACASPLNVWARIRSAPATPSGVPAKSPSADWRAAR
jgi:hypothetical protein